ncbi:RnfH family protein [Marinicella meishanensis]|uniref:RnfH family protein n=1 Tax=Marinicella meishanensis TaxID=2873263 RepID=UPI001CBDA3AA|nr:RnfH family protein [Marinicella sp. NBU2979]
MAQIELIYATPEAQELIQLEVPDGSTIEACIEASGVQQQHPEIDLQQMKVGVFSQIKPLSHVVQDGDRVEIYRPLIADPKAVRRKRAAAAEKK